MESQTVPLNPRITAIVSAACEREGIALGHLWLKGRPLSRVQRLRRRLALVLWANAGYFGFPTHRMITFAVSGRTNFQGMVTGFMRTADDGDYEWAEQFFNEWRARQDRAREVA